MKMLTIFVALVVVVLLLAGLTAVWAARHASKAPDAGTPAPDFTLNAQDGKPLSLHDFRGQWVVLYFYPKDFTSGCTKEARNFQRDLALYEQKHTIILGISGQDEASHEKFCTTEGLHFQAAGRPTLRSFRTLRFRGKSRRGQAVRPPYFSHRSFGHHSKGLSDG